MPGATIWVSTSAKTGGSSTSSTVTWNVCSSVAPAESVTRTTIGNVCPPCDSPGRHVNCPVAGSIVAPAGLPGARLKTIALAGRSGSLTAAVNRSNSPSSIGRVVDGREHGRFVLLGDGDENRLAVDGPGAVGRPNGDGVLARALRLGRRPGEHAGDGVDRGALGRGAEAEDDGQVAGGVGGHDREGQ